MPLSALIDLGHMRAFIWHYLIAFAVLLLTVATRKLVTEVLLGRLSRLTKTTQTDLDDRVLAALRRPIGLAILSLGIWGATLALGLEIGAEARPAIDADTARLLSRGIGVLWIFVLTWCGVNLADVVSYAISKLTERTETRLDDMLVPIVRRTIKLFCGLIGFILVVQNLGYSIGALLAGFSIGGVALALASQDTLQNAFGSIMIFVDRPFQVGDSIRVGDIEGVVEEVGLRSTRIRTHMKSLYTIPNAKIAHEAINNLSKRPKRRVKQMIGIGYTTEPDRIEAAVSAFRHILSEEERIDQSFWLVNFAEFGDSSLNILVYYFTASTVYTEHMAVVQDTNLRMMQALETLGIEISFPTRTVYLRQDKDPVMPPLEEAVRVLNPRGASPLAPTVEADDDD